MFEVYNLLNGVTIICDSLKEVFKIVKSEREILVTDEKGRKTHFSNGEVIGRNF